MLDIILDWTGARHRGYSGRAALCAAFLAAGGFALPPAASASDDDPAARDLSVEQSVVYAVQASAPAAPAADQLSVVAWVDHADNTYAVGERVRLFVRANKDAYVTVLNVGASGQTTILFPNAHQSEAMIAANQVVEIPPGESGASIHVSGPTGSELIKVIASTEPTPLFAAGATAAAGPFAMLQAGSRSLARDLQVTMANDPNQEWADYNKIITTIDSRPAAVVPLMPAPAGTSWPASPYGLRLATDKPSYRMGETVNVYASAAAPCYLTLINIGSSGQARVLLPNAAQPQNLIPAGETVVFPVVGSNLSLTPIGPPGVETVVALCSADNQPVFPAGLTYDQNGYALMAAGAAGSRDLITVTTTASPAQPLGQTAVAFVVTQ